MSKQNFSSLAIQTDLDIFLPFFGEKFKIFLRKFQNFPILKKFQIEHPERHLLPKFELSRIFTNISKMGFYTPGFSQEISKF
jgi:hypothetical protein